MRAIDSAFGTRRETVLTALLLFGIDGVQVLYPVEANGVFARLPRPAIDRLLAELPGEDPFYIWDDDRDEVRWMCAWDTAEADVDAFADSVREAVAA